METFTIEKIPRKKIKKAKYNPRVISDSNYSRLKKGLEEHGLVQPLVWNRTTGNLVGGHQRLKVLDEINGAKDYYITVAAIEVDEKKEKEINLLLNSQKAMGDFDLGKLEELLQEVDIEKAGFDLESIVEIYGSGKMVESKPQTIDEITKIASKITGYMKKIEDTAKQESEQEYNFYVVVVFRDMDERDAYLKKRGLQPSVIVHPKDVLIDYE